MNSMITQMMKWVSIRTTHMNSESDKWCGKFKRCNGCKLQSECMIKPEEMALIMEDGVFVDRWAIRTREMIRRELKSAGED